MIHGEPHGTGPDAEPAYREIARLLDELTNLQSDLLDHLAAKHDLLARRQFDALAGLVPQESALLERLRALQDRRAVFLADARSAGAANPTLRSLVRELPSPARESFQSQIDQVARQSRLAQQQMLTQWVAIQRSLLHLTQLLEIIATGGRLRPTYGKGAPAPASGALVDQAI